MPTIPNRTKISPTATKYEIIKTRFPLFLCVSESFLLFTFEFIRHIKFVHCQKKSMCTRADERVSKVKQKAIYMANKMKKPKKHILYVFVFSHADNFKLLMVDWLLCGNLHANCTHQRHFCNKCSKLCDNSATFEAKLRREKITANDELIKTK